MKPRTLSTLLATATLAAAPLLVRADSTDAVFEACSTAFIASLTETHGPIARIRVVPPATRPHSQRDPVSGMYAPARYTLFATEPKSGTVLASAECTAKPKAGVTLAQLPVPAPDSKPLVLAHETK